MNPVMRIQLLALSTSLLLCACSPGGSMDTAPETGAAETAMPTTSPTPADPRAPSDDAAPPVAPTPANPRSTTPATDAVTASDGAVNDTIESILGDHTKYQAVINGLQSAVQAGDSAAVAALAHYPIDVDIDGKTITLKNETEFVSRYKEFMTPDIGKAIVETEYADLFVNYKGVMFGSGQAWINGLCRDSQCKAFDVKLVTLQHAPG